MIGAIERGGVDTVYTKPRMDEFTFEADAIDYTLSKISSSWYDEIAH